MYADQQNFKNLFNVIPDFLFILDLNGNIIEFNNSVTSDLGYEIEDLRGQPILAVHPPEHRNSAAVIVRDMLNGLTDSCPLPLLAKDGRRIPVETKVFNGQWNGEKVLIGISRNLSEISISEEKFYKVFDNSQAMMAITVIDTGTFININKAFLKVLGYEKNELIGKNLKEISLYLNYQDRKELEREIQQNEVVENQYVKIRTKSGEPVHCLYSASVIKIQTIKYLLISATDISSLKETELKLKISLARQKLLADISQLFLSVDELDEKMEKALSLIGNYSAVGSICILLDNMQGSETNMRYAWCKPGIVSTRLSFQNISYATIPSWKKLFSASGKGFPVSMSNAPDDVKKIIDFQEIKSMLVIPLVFQRIITGYILFNEHAISRDWEVIEIDNLIAIAGIISNALERHSIQCLLRESELRQKLALENTEAGLWDWNIQTGEVYFNDMWYKMIGFEPGEIVPNVSSWEKLVHPDDFPDTMKVLEEHLSGKTEKYSNVHRLLTKSGKWKWILDKGKIVEYGADGKPLRAIGTHIDLDREKRIEEELRNLNETKDKVFSIIAHDLRGPIASMMNLSEMISENGRISDEDFYETINLQKELSQSTYQLLENLLNWARVNSNQIMVNPTKICLNDIVTETLSSLKYNSDHKEIIIRKEYHVPFEGYADEEMTRIVVRNLLSNAIKFTPRKGVITVEINNTNGYVMARFKDTGTGISPQNIKKILSDNHFYSTFGTDKERGTGLGLKLCKSLISLNHGELSVSSEVGKGSCFAFTLPRKTG